MVMWRAKKRKDLSSARHYDQIRFRFHTTKTHLRHQRLKTFAAQKARPDITRQQYAARYRAIEPHPPNHCARHVEQLGNPLNWAENVSATATQQRLF